MTNEFENFNDRDEEWLTELEIRATDLENELFDWREAHARELADSSYGRDGTPRRPAKGGPECCAPSPEGRRPGRPGRLTTSRTKRCTTSSTTRNPTMT